MRLKLVRSATSSDTSSRAFKRSCRQSRPVGGGCLSVLSRRGCLTYFFFFPTLLSACASSWSGGRGVLVATVTNKLPGWPAVRRSDGSAARLRVARCTTRRCSRSESVWWFIQMRFRYRLALYGLVNTCVRVAKWRNSKVVCIKVQRLFHPRVPSVLPRRPVREMYVI